jgi:hypothetical protein
VPVGSRVTFTNNHSAAHEMSSDPHPAHTLCTSLNVGLIRAPVRVVRAAIWTRPGPAPTTTISTTRTPR